MTVYQYIRRLPDLQETPLEERVKLLAEANATLRLLQRLDLIERISPYERAKATFVATGNAPAADPYIRPNAGLTFLGVRL